MVGRSLAGEDTLFCTLEFCRVEDQDRDFPQFNRLLTEGDAGHVTSICTKKFKLLFIGCSRNTFPLGIQYPWVYVKNHSGRAVHTEFCLHETLTAILVPRTDSYACLSKQHLPDRILWYPKSPLR